MGTQDRLGRWIQVRASSVSVIALPLALLHFHFVCITGSIIRLPSNREFYYCYIIAKQYKKTADKMKNSFCPLTFYLFDIHFFDHNGRKGLITVVGSGVCNLINYLYSLNNLAERRILSVKICTVNLADKEL